MLADCIRLAQTNNEALEALLQKFAPLIKKCGRQLHIEDGNEEMILAFIEITLPSSLCVKPRSWRSSASRSPNCATPLSSPISSNYYYIFSKINESDILENELKME